MAASTLGKVGIDTATVSQTAPWVVVAGGVNRQGGTDKANFALVKYLLERDLPVHVVTHQIEDALRDYPSLSVDLIPVPAGSRFAGEKLLSLRGRQVALHTTKLNSLTRVVVNGGNCIWPDVNWVHRVHHAWSPKSVDAPWIHRQKHRLAVSSAKQREIHSLRAARLLIANSGLTRRHLVELLGIDPKTVEVVLLGAESDWLPANAEERNAARTRLRQQADRLLILFLGAIGYDNNKGLDTLLQAWSLLCRRSDWKADLVVAGDGRALPKWKAAVARSGFSQHVRFLGFTDRVPELLAAADLLVSPVRYESYGLSVQEAICRGVPAIVTASTGFAERFPLYLRELLLPDPEDAAVLVQRILSWHAGRDYWRERVAEFSAEVRSYTWRDMAERFYELASGLGPTNRSMP